MPDLDPDSITALFTDAEGHFRFARWGRPIVPVIFGVQEEGLPVLKGAIEAIVGLSGHHMSENDPETGANLLIFFLKKWDELSAVDMVRKIVPDLDDLLPRLEKAGADQYRLFLFDEDGAIKSAFVFLNMSGELGQMPAADLGLEQSTKAMLSWAPGAFAGKGVLMQPEGGEEQEPILRPDLAAVLRAAYDPVLPAASEDSTLALRLSARAGLAMN